MAKSRAIAFKPRIEFEPSDSVTMFKELLPKGPHAQDVIALIATWYRGVLNDSVLIDLGILDKNLGGHHDIRIGWPGNPQAKLTVLPDEKAKDAVRLPGYSLDLYANDSSETADVKRMNKQIRTKLIRALKTLGFSIQE